MGAFCEHKVRSVLHRCSGVRNIVFYKEGRVITRLDYILWAYLDERFKLACLTSTVK